MRSDFGSIQRLGQDRYRIFWTDAGRRRSKRVNGTRDDAVKELARAYLQTGHVSRSITWTRYWSDVIEPSFGRLAEKTAYEYRRIWKRELCPRMGGALVSETTWRQVDRLLGEIESPSVQRAAYRLLKKLCNLAIRDGLLDANPVKDVKLKEHRKRQKTLVALDDVRSFLRFVEGFEYGYIPVMELGGGLRHEEACAITASDVEVSDRYAVLSVSKALVDVGGISVLKDTKTGSSGREVALGEPFRRALLRWELPKTVESLPRADTVTKAWRRYRKGPWEELRLGDLRTSFSMLHAEAGTDGAIVSMLMGHSGGSTRERNYMQANRRILEMAADILTDAV